jgi:hypothetical protein
VNNLCPDSGTLSVREAGTPDRHVVSRWVIKGGGGLQKIVCLQNRTWLLIERVGRAREVQIDNFCYQSKSQRSVSPSVLESNPIWGPWQLSGPHTVRSVVQQVVLQVGDEIVSTCRMLFSPHTQTMSYNLPYPIYESQFSNVSTCHLCFRKRKLLQFLRQYYFWSETSMGAIPFGSVTEMRYGEVRYGSDVVALFLPG